MKELQKKSVWEFFIRNYRFTSIIIWACVLLGIFSAIQIPKESSPEIDFPVAFVSTGYPGASPKDVEELVSGPIEDKILSMDKVSTVTSTSRSGISTVVVEFDVNSDSKETIADLKDKIDEVKSELPDDATDPFVKQISFSDQPILTFSLSGPFDVAQLKRYGEDLKDEIERLQGVSKVNVMGGQEREIKVIADKIKLDQFGIALTQITNAISGSNTDIPSGNIETAEENFALRFAGRLETAEDVKNIPIKTIGDAVITVKDVATVIDGYSEKTSVSRLSIKSKKSLPSVSLNVYKVSGGNILTIVEKIREKIDSFKKESLPESVVIETTQDFAKYTINDLNTLTTNGIQTIIIITIILFIFIGFRESITAGLSIPLTFLITFFILNSIGYTLNFLTLFSLILSLGILVDGTIVITEGINRHIKTGKTPKQAAVATVREFKTPLISGTLTTVFAFAPMALTSGIMGKFIRTIPITVSIVLLASLFVALGIVTTLGGRYFKPQKDNKRKKVSIIDKIGIRYEQSLGKLLISKASRRLVFIALPILLALSFMLPIKGILPINMFPAEDQDLIYIDIENKVGSILEATNTEVTKIEEELYKNPNIQSFTTNIGSASMAGSNESINSAYLGHIIINLKEDRTESSIPMIERYAKTLPKLTNAKVRVTGISSGPDSSAPVVVNITGEDLVGLESVARDIMGILEKTPGTRNIEMSIKEANGEFVFNVDRVKAQLYGVNTSQLAMTLRNAISGFTATTIKNNGKDIDVTVRYSLNQDGNAVTDKTSRTDFSVIDGLTIATAFGDIPLNSLVTKTFVKNQAGIEHKGGEKIVKVTSYTTEGSTAQEIVTAATLKINDLNLPSEYSITYGGEQEDIQQSFNDMFKAMILGVLMIAALLVLQFKSYRQPIFILMTIPLALIGVFPGLVMVNQPLSFPGVIGVVALAGIVVNNAIILVDKINRNRKEEGMEIEAAIMEAGKTRLQPIILTTITTITGLLPITIKEAGWAPMGYSIIFGLLFSTLLSLIVVPLLYQKFAKKELDTNGKHYKLDEDREHQGITKEYEKTVQSQTTASIKEATHQ